MNDGGHMHGMGSAAAAPSNGTMPMGMAHHHHMMMHMTFFWGKNAEILFDGWPGEGNLGMYVLALIVIFFVAFIIEYLSNCHIFNEKLSSSAAAGLAQTAMYAVRIGLAYLVMLAVMSFNAGVFLVAVFGHAAGFFLFGSRAFKKGAAVDAGKTSDLPPMNC